MKSLTTGLIALILIFTFGIADAKDGPKARLTAYDITRVTLQETVTMVVDGKPVTCTEGYLVRLHGDFPIRHADTMHLKIGDEFIEEYGGLPDGLYFIVYDPARLARMSNKPIRYRFNKSDPWRDFGQTFDPSRFDLKTVKGEAEALKAK